MARFHIMRVAVNQHHRMYDELIDVVARSLIDLGHTCSVALNNYQDEAINILIGASIFASRHLELPKLLSGRPFILYQIEYLDDARGLLKDWPEYRALLANAAWIWDYGPASTDYLRRNGFPRVTHLPPGYHRCLESLPTAPDAELDVVFCGTPHPRRRHILSALQSKGLKVAFNADVYGEPRNLLIAGAKVALNIHAWDDLNALETVRLSLLLANRRFVISETADHNPYGDGLVYTDYDTLVATCLDYLEQPGERRDEIAERGHQTFRKLDMIELLRAIRPENMGIEA